MIDLSQVTDIMLGNAPVEQVSDSRGNVLWSSAPVVLPNYFYVEDASGQANTFRVNKNGATPSYEVFGSTDRENWSSLGYTGDNIQVPLPANSKLYLYVTRPHWHSESSMWDFDRISCTGLFNIGGNIMSLLNGSNFEGTSLTTENWSAFDNILQSQPVVDASNLILPDNTVEFCYQGMFVYCDTLTTPPVLPATTLNNYCYSSMFNRCTSLTTAPVLPATTLAQNCYYGMFYSCTALTTAPVLPASTLAAGCYGAMFDGCFNLTTVTTYAQDISASNCVENWLNNVAPQGNFYNLGGATYTSGASGIPTGWTEHNSL